MYSNGCVVDYDKTDTELMWTQLLTTYSHGQEVKDTVTQDILCYNSCAATGISGNNNSGGKVLRGLGMNQMERLYCHTIKVESSTHNS